MDELKNVCVVEYIGTHPEKNAPHGNATRNTHEFIRAPEKTQQN